LIEQFKYPLAIGACVLGGAFKKYKTGAKSAPRARKKKLYLADGTPIYLTFLGGEFGAWLWKVFFFISAVFFAACFSPHPPDDTSDGGTELTYAAICLVAFAVGGMLKSLHDDSIAHSIEIARGNTEHISTPDLLKIGFLCWVFFGGGLSTMVGFIFAGYMVATDPHTGYWVEPPRTSLTGMTPYEAVLARKRDSGKTFWVDTSNTTHLNHP